MSERIERERQFHDERFRGEDHVRLNAKKYYSVAGASRAAYSEAIGRAVGERVGPRVLEYGCGARSEVLQWVQAGGRLMAIDLSVEAVRAFMRGAEIGVERCNALVMNAEQLAFDTGAFDAVVGTGILHHLDLDQALSEVGRVLRPDGVGVFLEPLGHNPLISAYRRLTPTMRTTDEHPLVRGDIDALKRHFKSVRASFFHLSSLGAVVLRKSRLFERALRLSDTIDRALLSTPLRWWAWMVLLELGEPRVGGESAGDAPAVKRPRTD